ncbi:hypothetical protein B0H17DRAFT_1141025 [Mycena rosella]|uniref:Uncharacterized protein n=1 Tax=Mycena rosella TaxID=1033263 RepID=A0AAD7D0J7_MYCRO|nr:hypothetical protein B0H17DRAFT_1141025 [Mycena rosella]
MPKMHPHNNPLPFSLVLDPPLHEPGQCRIGVAALANNTANDPNGTYVWTVNVGTSTCDCMLRAYVQDEDPCNVPFTLTYQPGNFTLEGFGAQIWAKKDGQAYRSCPFLTDFPGFLECPELTNMTNYLCYIARSEKDIHTDPGNPYDVYFVAKVCRDCVRLTQWIDTSGKLVKKRLTDPVWAISCVVTCKMQCPELWCLDRYVLRNPPIRSDSSYFH